MVTTEAISVCQGTFRGKTLTSKKVSFKSNPRQKSMVAMACPRFDPHSTLGVAHDASKTEIQRAYRQLALQYHPNKGAQNTTNFQLINLAYEALLDMLTPEFSYETLVSMASAQFEKFEGEDVEEKVGGGEWEEWMGFEGASCPLDDAHPVNEQAVWDYSDLLEKALEVLLSGNYWEEWMGWEGASGSPFNPIPHLT